MKPSFLVSFTLVFVSAACALAVDHRVEKLEEGPPADALSMDIVGQLSPSGFQVIRGSSRIVCEIWLCKEWPVKENFQPTGEVLYPFEAGQLIGALRFRRRGKDFRDQQVSRGVYTLRYGQQPIDGNHVGTSPTRDFLLLIKAENDQSSARMDVEQLMESSAEVADSGHPAMLCLPRVGADRADATPSIRHDEFNDWWIVRFAGKAKAGDTTRDQLVDLVVAGHAAE